MVPSRCRHRRSRPTASTPAPRSASHDASSASTVRPLDAARRRARRRPARSHARARRPPARRPVPLPRPVARRDRGGVGELVVGDLDDPAAIARTARGASVITYEWEGVPATGRAGGRDGAHGPTRSRALEVAQDRLTEKQTLARLGIAVAPFAAIDGPDDIADAIASDRHPAAPEDAPRWVRRQGSAARHRRGRCPGRVGRPRRGPAHRRSVHRLRP